ncbi:MAG: ribokinase [Clostridia bacterium]|nr:ribokinase [Clostridia bacterium]
MKNILVVGSLNMDETVRMDVFPSAGQTVVGSSVLYAPGGKGNNQCIAAKRLGGNVKMAGMLGNDAHGKTLRALLFDEGITDGCVFACGLPTGMAQIQIDREGQNRICVVPSANHAFGGAEIGKIDGALREADFVVLQLELRIDVTEEIVRRAHGYGKTILLNPAPAAKLSPDILPLADYLIPNESELSGLTGLPSSTDGEVVLASEKLRASGVRNVIVTLGKRGVYANSETFTGFVPGFPVRAVDTVAAGDCFIGAFAVGLSEGKSVPDSLRFANAAAALSVQTEGAVPSLPARQTVDAFLAERY